MLTHSIRVLERSDFLKGPTTTKTNITKGTSDPTDTGPYLSWVRLENSLSWYGYLAGPTIGFASVLSYFQGFWAVMVLGWSLCFRGFGWCTRTIVNVHQLGLIARHKKKVATISCWKMVLFLVPIKSHQTLQK